MKADESKRYTMRLLTQTLFNHFEHQTPADADRRPQPMPAMERMPLLAQTLFSLLERQTPAVADHRPQPTPANACHSRSNTVQLF